MPSGEPSGSSDTRVSSEAAPDDLPSREEAALAGIPAELLASDNAYEAWFNKYKLDLKDPKMLDADPDGDGATNRDEFMGDTNPNDPNSRPGIHKFMRLKEYTEVKLPLILESVEGSQARIKQLEPEPKVETVVAGQSVAGLKVERVISRRDTDKEGVPVDLSRVILRDPATNQNVTLVKDMPAKSAASSAVLMSADGQTTVTIKEGDVFSWPTEQGTTYKVIDLRADQAVVQEVETKKMWTLPRQ